jgi:hypothetical protein
MDMRMLPGVHSAVYDFVQETRDHFEILGAVEQRWWVGFDLVNSRWSLTGGCAE